jgi:hypothetical protein
VKSIGQSGNRQFVQRFPNESETKPPSLEKKPNFKTANGRRVPLTDLLGWTVTHNNPTRQRKKAL